MDCSPTEFLSCFALTFSASPSGIHPFPLWLPLLPPRAFTPSPSGGRQGWGPCMAGGVGYAWLAPTLALPQRGRERITLTPALSHKWEREYTQAMVRQVVGMHWVAPTLIQRGRECFFPLPFTGEGQGEGAPSTSPPLFRPLWSSPLPPLGEGRDGGRAWP